MKKRVTVVDDTLRANEIQVVTPQMCVDHLKKRGRPFPPGTRFLLVKDRQGRQVQRIVRVVHVYEGRHLEHAVRRAKRWMRGPRFSGSLTGAPRHINLAMAAFFKADPEGFRGAVNARAS